MEKITIRQATLMTFTGFIGGSLGYFVKSYYDMPTITNLSALIIMFIISIAVVAIVIHISNLPRNETLEIRKTTKESTKSSFNLNTFLLIVAIGILLAILFTLLDTWRMTDAMYQAWNFM